MSCPSATPAAPSRAILLKRQVRNAFQRHATGLPGGLWLVRLRTPFAVTEFVSARSAALAAAARDELDTLLRRAAVQG